VHPSEELSVRINGRRARRIEALSSEQYFSVNRRDQKRLVLLEFHTGRQVTDAAVIISRKQSHVRIYETP
jgi:hypothetical protein